MSKPRALPTVSFHVWTQLGSTFLQLFAQVGKTAVELAFAKSALSAAGRFDEGHVEFFEVLTRPARVATVRITRVVTSQIPKLFFNLLECRREFLLLTGTQFIPGIHICLLYTSDAADE